MTALSLFVVFVIAKLAALGAHADHWSALEFAAYFWQDAVVALAFAVTWRFFEGRLLRAVYWTLTIYAAINIPVERAVFTPLTMPMIRAARGPLADSMTVYLTAANLMLVAANLIVAFLLPRVLRRVPRAVSTGIFMCGVVIAAAGPIAAARINVHGMDRNVVTPLIGTRLPAVQAATQSADWRSLQYGTAEDLSSWVGSAKGFNVVMISLESTAAEYLSLGGAVADPMPNLSALAKHALVFENAYAVYPESIKGLYSVLCSAYPAFDTKPEQYAKSGCESIASVLRTAGYRTAMFHSGRFNYLGMESMIRNRGYDVLADAGDIGGNHNSSFGVDEPATVARMLAWIDALPPGQRFFLNYLPIAGHHPYATPEPGPFRGTSDLDQYRNALRYGDASLGTLIAGICARGLERNTVWVIYGDHGEAFEQHEGNYGHTFYIYEENVHVPFVIAAPAIMRSQQRLSKVVSLVDTAPTVLDLLGIPTAANYEGHSMLDGARRTALFFTDYSLGLFGLRDGRWKFIYETGSGRLELYDIDRDPRESINVALEHGNAVSTYRDIVRGWSGAQKARLLASHR
ncbi:MAG TPA: sulfatase [Bryobacteraceae bacterium]|nr:sulfatase [Bryobacteraceae bacterium]